MLEGQTGNAMKGNDLVESMITLWQEIEYITADDMIFQHDHTSLQLFHKVLLYYYIITIVLLVL